jgi:hypothetical protein
MKSLSRIEKQLASPETDKSYLEDKWVISGDI